MSVGQEKSKVILHGCTWDSPFLCQGKVLEVVDSYKYLGQVVRVSRTLLHDLAGTQIRRFHVAASTLREGATQLRISALGLRVQLAVSQCVSHLLFGCVTWAPAMPPIPSLRPGTSYSEA